MPLFEFVGQSSQDSDNSQVATSRLLNMYREPVKLGDKTDYVLKSTLGTTPFADLETVFMRAMERVGLVVMVVAGGSVYRIDGNRVVTNFGEVVDSEQTTISGNNGITTVCAGGKYYTVDGGVISEPAPGAFSDFGSVSYFGNYTILLERDGRRFQWSDLTDPHTLPGLNFATTEARDEFNIRGMPIGNNFWIFKNRSTEIWYLTGASGANAFARVSGGVNDVGLLRFDLVTKHPAGAFFVGSDGIAYLTDGGGIRPISTTAVETAIAEETPTNCFYYEDEGHKICVIRFQDRPAWCLDISTGEWHERSEGTDHGAWCAVASVYSYGHWNVGTDLGQMYRLVRNNQDVSGEMRRTAVSRTMSNDQGLFVIDKVEFTGRVGKADLGRDASCWIRVSRNNGQTWSEPKKRSLGALGEYEKRITYRNMGQFRQATVEINVSDPAEIPINAAASVDIS
ncbi:MAG: hypothetical protein ACPG4X_19345 [Pikeienuella sp.]